jgi:hypothetical protein
MKVLVDNIALFSEDVRHFKDALAVADIAVETEHPPGEPVQLASPAALLTVQIDPQTIKLIFEYLAALLAVHKTTSYADVFVKEIVTALGKATGEKLAELSKTAGKHIVDGSIALFKNVSNRILASLANGNDSRIYLTFEANLEDISLRGGRPDRNLFHAGCL